jgi:hypothetical protein
MIKFDPTGYPEPSHQYGVRIGLLQLYVRTIVDAIELNEPDRKEEFCQKVLGMDVGVQAGFNPYVLLSVLEQISTEWWTEKKSYGDDEEEEQEDRAALVRLEELPSRLAVPQAQ